MDKLKKLAQCESNQWANTSGKTLIFAALIIAAAMIISSIDGVNGSSGFMLFIFVTIFLALFGNQGNKSDSKSAD